MSSADAQAKRHAAERTHSCKVFRDVSPTPASRPRSWKSAKAYRSLCTLSVRREDKASKWLHTASPPIKTIIWCCFAAGVDAVMLRVEERRKDQQKEKNGFELNHL